MGKDKSENHSEIKLHLGCGNNHLNGFINIDCRKLKEVDIVSDLEELKQFKDGSADVIYSSHTLEHFSHRKTKKVLREWRRVLKKDGNLFLAVPDFKKFVIRFVLTRKIESIIDPLFGGQGYETNYHYSTFTYRYLKQLLKEVGFVSVKKSKFKFLPDNFGDSSSHWSSLNIEARK